MTAEGLAPRLERTADGGAIVRASTDLKRHSLNDEDLSHCANEQIPQGRLNESTPESDFAIAAPVRPTDEFLTRTLWDVGNTGPYGHRGDLTTITEAILVYGGEARVTRDEFLALPKHEQDQVIESLRCL